MAAKILYSQLTHKTLKYNLEFQRIMVKKYEFLPHTADAQFRAYGRTQDEAFANAALATYTIITDISKVKPKITKSVAIHSRAKDSLLYDFIGELLFLTDTEAFLVCKVDKLTIRVSDAGYTLTAKVLGDTADAYEIKTQIKAVTYNDMFIKEEKGRWIIQVVVDI